MRDVDRFLKDIKLFFPVFEKEEKNFYNQARNNILKDSDNGSLSYEECEEKFGKPKEIVDAYLDEMDSHELTAKIKRMKSKKKILIIACSVIVAMVLCLALYKAYLYKKGYEDFQENIPVEYEETIEEIE